MRIFVDANIVISAVLFPSGVTASIFSRLLAAHTIVLSDYTVSECKNVFVKKFPNDIEKIERFLSGVHFERYSVPRKISKQKFPNIRDVKDIPVLAAAILSDADILLTGDKDFADIKIDKPLVLTPSQCAVLLGI